MIKWLLASILTLIELNCENLFDCTHDAGKLDAEWLPTGTYRWTPHRYYKKLNGIARIILSQTEDSELENKLPSLIILTEVENDSVMRDLTKRSLLKNAGYNYIMTNSPDARGIDVALMYDPFAYRLMEWHGIRITPSKGMKATRDILYAKLSDQYNQTVFILGVHAPSKLGGEKESMPFRRTVIDKLICTSDSIRQQDGDNANIIIMGDFNTGHNSQELQPLLHENFINVTQNATGRHGAKASYKYHGKWESIDHCFMSSSLAKGVMDSWIGDKTWTLIEDDTYGGLKPFRCYLGPKYLEGYSDHLPLVITLTTK